MRITLAQLNSIVGDITGNAARIKETVAQVAGESDLVVFPEMYLIGYPPLDLLERPGVIVRIEEAMADLLAFSRKYADTALLFGAPTRNSAPIGKPLCNSAVVIQNGVFLQTQNKSLLPTYDVFDEARHFEPASHIEVLRLKGETLGISICEDFWNEPSIWQGGRQYRIDPIGELAARGATILINLSASPFSVGKASVRHRLMIAHARRHALPFIFVNQVGANDELIFDGHSVVFGSDGNLRVRLESFQEEIRTIETAQFPPALADDSEAEDVPRALHNALVLGIRDYARKCGFRQAVIGLSGGIDSAVTASLAVAALGPENVIGLTMPSPYSSAGSVDDSLALAKNLGMVCRTVSIAEVYDSYLATLEPHFDTSKIAVTEENLQARIRGNVIMAFANEKGYLPLATGNKSELAVGYCTLYGDMSGGLCVLSDVPKVRVYDIARFINLDLEIIPQNSISKPPSAELRPNQKDSDALPPYDILDAILEAYIEERLTPREIIERGYNEKSVTWITGAVNRNEYKRWQAAPGLKVTSKAFGIGRRMPIAARVVE